MWYLSEQQPLGKCVIWNINLRMRRWREVRDFAWHRSGVGVSCAPLPSSGFNAPVFAQAASWAFPVLFLSVWLVRRRWPRYLAQKCDHVTVVNFAAAQTSVIASAVKCGPREDFFPGETNSGEIPFHPLETKKTTLFAKNFIGKCQIPNSTGPFSPCTLLPTPMTSSIVAKVWYAVKWFAFQTGVPKDGGTRWTDVGPPPTRTSILPRSLLASCVGATKRSIARFRRLCLFRRSPPPPLFGRSRRGGDGNHEPTQQFPQGGYHDHEVPGRVCQERAAHFVHLQEGECSFPSEKLKLQQLSIRTLSTGFDLMKSSFPLLCFVCCLLQMSGMFILYHRISVLLTCVIVVK